MTVAPLVRLHDVSIGYDGEVVLSGIDLAVEPGEFVAVLGANGSGKSTLIRGLLGLAQLHGGRIELFGQPTDEFADRWRIGYVPQRTAIAGALPATVDEVVTSGRLARMGWRTRLRANDRDAVSAALDTTELTDLRGRPVAQLSGGQQRRVTIARALAAEPDLLILDEPAAGIDAESQERLAATLAGLAERGTTVMLIAHELGHVADLISRVIVMRDGGIVFDGSPTAPDAEPAGHDHVHHHLDDDAHAPLRPGTGLEGW